VVATAVTVTALLAPASPIAATESSPTFVEALAAIPEATAAVAAARVSLRQTRADAQVITELHQSTRMRLDAEQALARDAALARVRADAAAVAAQDAIDDAARAVYISGGGVPSLAEVMLTADTAEGFGRSLVTRAHLGGAAAQVIQRADAVRGDAQEAASAAAEALNRRDAAAEVEAVARADADEAAAALASAEAEVDRSRARVRTLMRITRADRSAEYGRVKKCGDWLAKLLSRQGFEGEDLREAWAIVMRESGGREDAVSVTNDLGLFQINTATWKAQPWFDRKALLTRKYNAKVAHLLSRGGKSWYSWGLDGHGRPNAGAYVNAGWTQERILSHIVRPYIQWYAQYPCRPADEPDLELGLPELPRSEIDDPALQEGDGVRPSSQRPESRQPSSPSPSR
jgi:hypothetical protein